MKAVTINIVGKVPTTTVAGPYLSVTLDDGRIIQTPLAWYPKLTAAFRNNQTACLANFRLIAGGEGIRWPDLDEDLSVANMFGYRDVLDDPIRGYLVANFVPESERADAIKKPLKEIVKHVVEHHNWHHDAERPDYVRKLEIDLDNMRRLVDDRAKRSMESEAEYIRRHRALQSSLRNQFASAVLAGLLDGVIDGRELVDPPQMRAAVAVLYADALIVELEKKK